MSDAGRIVGDLRHLGPAVWERFKGGHDGSLWYYRTLAEIFRERRPGPLAEELARVVGEMESVA